MFHEVHLWVHFPPGNIFCVYTQKNINALYRNLCKPIQRILSNTILFVILALGVANMVLQEIYMVVFLKCTTELNKLVLGSV